MAIHTVIAKQSWYNVRTGQSQVMKHTDAELARAAACFIIWRANATRECWAFSWKTEGFSGFCP